MRPAFCLPMLCLYLVGCQGNQKEQSKKEQSKVAAPKAPIVVDIKSRDKTPIPDDLGYGPDVRVYQSTQDAIAYLLKSRPKVIGFGEFHKLQSSAPLRSALSRFTKAFDTLGPDSSLLVLETWSVDPRCGQKSQEVTKKISQAIERPKENQSEMQALVAKARQYHLGLHFLHFSCEEYEALLDNKNIRTEKLLIAVTDKLAKGVRLALSGSNHKTILVYGGSTHNDKVPYPGLEAWSYVKPLGLEPDEFLEVDLYVPEFVQNDKVLRGEAWYPLLKEARKDKVILIHRDQGSYILIMRKDYKI